jgi:hypothetical protein
MLKKTNALFFKYKFEDSYIGRADCIKNLGVLIHSKLYFDCHFDYIFN